MLESRQSMSFLPDDPMELDDRFRLFNGDYVPTAPLRFRRHLGRVPVDHMTGGDTAFVFLSDRVIESFVANGFTGWATYPVELFGSDRQIIAGYQGLAVTGRCGPIDDARSAPYIAPPPVPEGESSRWWRGLYFDEASWDGSDIFKPDGLNTYRFVTEAVRDVIEDASFTNFSFTPLAEEFNYQRS